MVLDLNVIGRQSDEQLYLSEQTRQCSLDCSDYYFIATIN